MDHPIITREQARERGIKRYFTGDPCPRGHICERWASNAKCVECSHEEHAYRRELTKANLAAIEQPTIPGARVYRMGVFVGISK